MTASPPPRDPTIGWILEHFAYLTTDHEFVSAWLPPAVVTFDYPDPVMPFQVRVKANHDLAVLEVECRWPSEVDASGRAPAIPLVDLVAMRAPDVDVPRDISTPKTAEDTIARCVDLLREYGWDAPYGAWGMLFDYVAWQRASGTDGWWNQPPFDEMPEPFGPRTAEEIATDREFQPIHALVHRDAEAAWPAIVAFIQGHPGSLDALTLLEDLLELDADAFIDRIEAEARIDGPFRDAVEWGYQGQTSGPAIDRFERLHEEIRRSREPGAS